VRTTDVQFVKDRERRRSQRVCVSIDVVVLWGGATRQLASEETKTLIVNAHGALVLLRKAVHINDIIKLRNTTAHEEVACRVVHLSESDHLGMTNVGAELVEPAPRFWHIAFPPADWTPRSPEAKSHTPRTSSKPVKTGTSLQTLGGKGRD
jgi:hypothetical protein